jgi:hypothetical protein
VWCSAVMVKLLYFGGDGVFVSVSERLPKVG